MDMTPGDVRALTHEQLALLVEAVHGRLTAQAEYSGRDGSDHEIASAFSQTMANFVRNSVLMHSRPVLLAIEALESCPSADDARSRVRRALSVLREGSVLEGSVTCPDCELEFPRGDEHVCNATRID